MMLCNLPFFDSTGYQDLKLQDLHFCVCAMTDRIRYYMVGRIRI